MLKVLRQVDEALGELADVVIVPCGQKPRNLPFLALHDAVSTFAGKAYVAFGEADLTWRFASCDLGVPSCRGAFTPSTRLVSISQ